MRCRILATSETNKPETRPTLECFVNYVIKKYSRLVIEGVLGVLYNVATDWIRHTEHATELTNGPSIMERRVGAVVGDDSRDMSKLDDVFGRCADVSRGVSTRGHFTTTGLLD